VKGTLRANRGSAAAWSRQIGQYIVFGCRSSLHEEFLADNFISLSVEPGAMQALEHSNQKSWHATQYRR